jgi:hypothetical protein
MVCSNSHEKNDFENRIATDRFPGLSTQVDEMKVNLALLTLPQNLREIIFCCPKHLLQVSPMNSPSVSNLFKATVEDFTSLEWDWWPLNPRIPDVAIGQYRLEWQVSKSMSSATTEQA